MATLSDFSSALDSFFSELSALALADLTGQSAAVVGALDPYLDGIDAPLLGLRDEIDAALAGLVVDQETNLAAALADAITTANIAGVSASAFGDTMRLVFDATREVSLPGQAALTGLGTEALGLDLTGFLNLSANASVNLALDFSVTGPNGTLSVAEDGAAEDVRLALTATLDGSSLPGRLQLGVIEGDLEFSDTSGQLNGAEIAVSLNLDGDAPGALNPTVQLAALARLALGFDVGFTSDFLPGLDGTLVLDYGAGLEGGLLSQLGGVSLENLTIGVDALDDLLDRVLGPLDDIANAMPLGPVIRLLNSPLPVIDKLGPESLDVIEGDGGITLLDLLQAWGSAQPDESFFVTVIEILNTLQVLGQIGADGGINLGDVALSSGAIQTILDGESGSGLLDAFEFPDFDTGIFSESLSDLFDQTSSLEDGGLSFPLLSDTAPELAAKLFFTEFLRDPIPLVEFLLPEFKLDREDASFEVVIPIGPFAAVLSGGFEAALRIGAGISTRGIIEGGGEFGDSLYLTTPMDADGQRLSLVEMTADLGGDVGVKVPGLQVTGGGGILGEVEAGLGDSDDQPQDGLAHLRTIELPCLFDDLTGALTAGLRVTVKVGLKPFEFKRVKSFAEVEIAKFNITCSETHGRREPFVLEGGLATLGGPETGIQSDQMWLNVGEDRDDLRDIPGDDLDPNEVFIVRRMTPPGPYDDPTEEPLYDAGALQVDGAGVSQVFAADRVAGLSILRAEAGNGDDVISLVPGIDLIARFFGGAGADLLVSGDGNDVVEGGAGDDIISTGDGDDTVRAGAGDDVIRASLGADRIDGDTSTHDAGGEGYDQVDYSASDGPVRLERSGDSVFGFGGLAEGDELTNVEYLIGTAFGDTLSGDDLSASTLDGEGGNDLLVGGEDGDLLIGGAGADAMVGRGGLDVASYVTSFNSVTVDLMTGFAFGADAEGDTLDRIEGLQGSMYGDTLTGNSQDNLLLGFAGNDLIDGRGGADNVQAGGGNDVVLARGDGDTLDGGGAITRERDEDLLSYENAGTAIVARLSPALYDGELDDGLENDDIIRGALRDPLGTERSDVRSSFENLRGSESDDDLGGDHGVNRIEGGGGADVIRAFAGNDTVAGGAGADDMYGGPGSDWLDYSASPAGVTVSFQPDADNEGGDAEGDTVDGFENIIGSDFADTLTGDGGDNIFAPLGTPDGPGADFVDGGGDGLDTLRLNLSELDTAVGLIGGVDGAGSTSGSFSIGPEVVANVVTFERIERFEIHGTIMGDILTLGDFDDRVFAGAGNDIIAGGLGRDVILAEAGDDLVFSQIGEVLGDGGGGEFFFLDGGDGFDGLSVDLGDAPEGVRLVMRGGTQARDDQIVSFETGAVITGFEFIGRVGGTAFADELRQPGRYSNEFRTGGGDDIIAPGLGLDTVDGGETPTDPSLATDADLLILDYSVEDNGQGVFMLADDTGGIGARREYSEFEENPFPYDNLYATNIEYAHITGTNHNDLLLGVLDPEYFIQGDILRGLDGEDLLVSFNGPDELYGGAGPDDLSSSGGADRLQGGLAGRDDGVDSLRGGPGPDTFVLGDYTGLHYGETLEGATSADSAVIQDFVSGTDRIQLVARAANYDLIEFGGDTFIQTAAGRNSEVIARIIGVQELDLTSADFTYVTQTEGPGGIGFAAALAAPEGIGDLQSTAPQNSGTGFAVTQGLAADNLGAMLVQTLSAQGFAINAYTIQTEREGDARAFGTFINAPGLSRGVGISTGKIDETPGLNSADGGLRSHLFGGNQFDLDFEQIGTLGGPDDTMTFYRANLADVPVSIRSLVIADDDDGVGGAGGARSGADIAGIALTTADFSDIEVLSSGDAAALDNPDILPRLDLFDFSPLGTFFTQGELRSANPVSGQPIASGPDANGALGGFVNNARATLGAFDFDSAANSGYLSLGDGGQLGLNLTGEIGADDPIWLIVAEAGGSERFDGAITASPASLIPEGDLSTDFGAPGAADDTITYVVEFELDFSASDEPPTLSGGPLGLSLSGINYADAAYAKLFDAVLASEEIREFSGTDLQDSISIRLNGIEAGRLSDGAAPTLERLALGPVGPYHDDLTLNLVDATVAPLRSDAFTEPFSIEGYLVNGLNRLEITIADRRDGYLDTALFLARPETTDIAQPSFPATPAYLGNEDAPLILGALPNEPFAPSSFEVAFESGPSHGTLVLSTGGSFSFAPDPDFAGADSFVYAERDADGSVSYGRAVIRVLPQPDAPDIDSAASFEVPENTLEIAQVEASDADGDALSFAISGGADADAFAIDAATGVLRFRDPVALSEPGDSDGDNRYEVEITVSDGRLTAVQHMTVHVVGTLSQQGVNVEGTAGADVINTAQSVAGQPLPGALDDTIRGNGGDDIINAGAGDDIVLGGLGNDTLMGGPGDDLFDGGDGIDTVSFADAGARVAVFLNRSDDVGAGQGADTFISIENVIGTDFNDRINGNGADNRLMGGLGDDELYGLAGNDTLDGGDGNDLLVGAGGDDTLRGGDGDDVIDGQGGADLLQGGAGNDSLIGNVGVDTIEGGAGSDNIAGFFGQDTIFGGDGDDDIRADGSFDVVEGGAGNDRIVGGNGKDILWGGSGNDVLFGGSVGAGGGTGLRDVFVFKSFANGGGGFDIIADFEDTIDKIDLTESGYTNFADVFADAFQDGTDVRINFDFGGLLRIDNFDIGDLTAGDFLF